LSKVDLLLITYLIFSLSLISDTIYYDQLYYFHFNNKIIKKGELFNF